jgi:hypothetical protein
MGDRLSEIHAEFKALLEGEEDITKEELEQRLQALATETAHTIKSNNDAARKELDEAIADFENLTRK